MKRIIILIFSLIVSTQLMAQRFHTVKSGETLSAIARDYGTTVGDIMRLNGMNADSKLIVGERIQIPPSGKTILRGRTHTIQSGETLSAIAQQYGTTVGDIMRLNGMNADSKLVIGEVINIPDAGVAVARNDAPVASPADDGFEIAEAPSSADLEDNSNTQPVFIPPATAESSVNQGVFAGNFKTAGTEVSTSGEAKTFKSESGWTDHKYFILMNDIEPGKVVKVESGNGNVIYAKVLWNLGGGRENRGLTYRINEAAAQTLGIADNKFTISVSYYR